MLRLSLLVSKITNDTPKIVAILKRWTLIDRGMGIGYILTQ